MRAFLFVAVLLAALPAIASAQSTGTPHDVVLPPLPPPALADSARPTDALRAAQGALAAGRLGEAQEALEMAQTRMLDRSVPLGQTNNPNDNPTVRSISLALQALAAHDRASSMQAIQLAIQSATAQGL